MTLLEYMREDPAILRRLSPFTVREMLTEGNYTISCYNKKALGI